MLGTLAKMKVTYGVGGIILGFILGFILFSTGGGDTTTAPAVDNEETVTLGAILPLSGDIAAIGQNSREAIELAVQEVNDAGGVDGKQLVIIFEDGKCGAKDAANAANKLVNVDGVPAIVGGVCSSETLAAAPIAESGKTVMLSPCSSSPDVTDAGDFIFRDYPSDLFQGKRAAEIALEDLGAETAAILYCLSDWCVGLDKVFEKTFEDLGGSIVAEEEYEQDAKDLRAQLTKIKEADPDMIYFVGYTEATVIGLRQIKELGIDVPLLGADAWNDPTILKEAGDATEGIMWVQPFAPLTDDFKAAMEAKTGDSEITLCSPQAYDAVHILANVINGVGTDGTAIKDALYDIKGYDGVSGVVTLDENGDLASANYEVKVIENGEAVTEE